MREKVETILTTTNGWLVAPKFNVVVKMKEVQVINETIVSCKRLNLILQLSTLTEIAG